MLKVVSVVDNTGAGIKRRRLSALFDQNQLAKSLHRSSSPFPDQERFEKQFTSGNSGALIFKVVPLDGHPYAQSGQSIILKVGTGVAAGRVNNDILFYQEIGAQAPSLMTLFPKYYGGSYVQDKAYYYMEDLGEERLIDRVNNVDGVASCYRDHLVMALDMIFKSVNIENMPDPEHRRDEIFFKRILDRYQSKILVQARDRYPIVGQRDIGLDVPGKGKTMYLNPFFWLQDINAGADAQSAWIRNALKIYVSAPFPSDLTSLNMMIRSVDGHEEVKLIDPGAVYYSPIYGLGKSIFPFSMVYPALCERRISVHLDHDCLSCGPTLDAEGIAHNLQAFRLTLSFLDRVASARPFLNREPFAELMMLTISCVQFGADMVYRLEDRTSFLADFYYFTLYVQWLDQVWRHVYTTLNQTLNLDDRPNETCGPMIRAAYLGAIDQCPLPLLM